MILISTPEKTALFRATHILSQKTRFEMEKLKINFSKVVQQHYIGQVGKSISFALHIISIYEYSVQNTVEMGQHM